LLAEKQARDAKGGGEFDKKVAAKAMDAILCPKVSKKSTDTNDSKK
jgi:hypothetical protein